MNFTYVTSVKHTSNVFPGYYSLMCFIFILLNSIFNNIYANKNIIKDNPLECYYSNIQKIYVHLNKDTYVSGENLLFNGYLVNAANIPDTICKVAYIELLNAANQKITGFSVNIKKGVFNSYLALPDSLSTGFYKILAFTNQMRNFNHDYYFSTKILIANQADEELDKLILYEKTIADSIKSINNNINNYKIYSVLTTDKTLNITITCKLENKQDSLSIECHNNSKSIFKKTITISKEYFITIPHENIQSGLNILTVCNKSGQLLCKEALYIPENHNFIELKSDQKKYTPRQKISLTIFLQNKNLIKEGLNISLNITQKKPGTINNYGLSIEPYLNQFSIIKNQDIENIMYQDTSYNSIYKNIMNFEFPKPISKSILNFLPENKNKIISGTVISKSGIPIINRYIYLSTIDTFANLKYCTTDYNGKFFFELENFYDNKNLILQVKDENKESLKIEEDDKFKSETPQKTTFEFIPSNLKTFLQYNQKIALTNKIFKTNNSTSSHTDFLINKPITGNFYGKPNFILIPSDYDEMLDFKEITHNILPYTSWNPLTNKAIIQNLEQLKLPTNEALILLNNIPFPDPAFISKLGTKQIKKIELRANHLLYGDIDFFGVLSITTNQENVLAFDNRYFNSIYPNTVNENSVSLLGPDYGNSDINKIGIPDLRQTLYWNPDINLSENGQAIIEFYASDLQSVYNIELEGITSTGKIISAKSTLEISK